jgi:hypothetical protein
MTAEEIAALEAFEDTDFSDCPEITDEEWRTAQPLYPPAPKTGRDLLAGLDDFTVRYLTARAAATQQTPAAIIGELVRKELAATA